MNQLKPFSEGISCGKEDQFGETSFEQYARGAKPGKTKISAIVEKIISGDKGVIDLTKITAELTKLGYSQKERDDAMKAALLQRVGAGIDIKKWTAAQQKKYLERAKKMYWMLMMADPDPSKPDRPLSLEEKKALWPKFLKSWKRVLADPKNKAAWMAGGVNAGWVDKEKLYMGD